VDPCGENGEYHTFVFDGPIFQAKIDITLGERVVKAPFVYQDVLPGGLS
jgi:diphthamide synthase (EF-2-diphthine--ammonia ligase)